MKVLQINNPSQQILESSEKLILLFGSPKCHNCLKLLDQIHQNSSKYEILYIDGDKFSEYADIYNVEYYPTIVLLNNTQVVATLITSSINELNKLCLMHFG